MLSELQPDILLLHERATREYFLELQAIRFGGKNMHDPDVDLLSFRSLAQSESLYALRENFGVEAKGDNNIPYCTVPLRYLNNL